MDDLDLDDREYEDEMRQERAADMAMSPKATVKQLMGTQVEERGLTEEEDQAYKDQKRDLELWANELPNYKDEAAFHGNLHLRLLRGIPNAVIQKMSVKDRIDAARKCFDIRQLLLDRPTANVNFQERKQMVEALPALMKELKRRQQEQKNTINITPGEGME